MHALPMKHCPATVIVLSACVLLDRMIALLTSPDLFDAVFSLGIVAAAVAIVALRSRIAWAVFLFVALSAMSLLCSYIASGALPADELSVESWAHLVLQIMVTILLLTPPVLRWVWKRQHSPSPVE